MKLAVVRETGQRSTGNRQRTTASRQLATGNYEMSDKRNFKDLVVWQRAVDLVAEIYVATRDFPRDELYGLTSQVRRAAVSIPSNIAEGQGRLTRGEFRQFLGQAKGSLAEVETQLIIAHRLGYLASPDSLLEHLNEVGRLLNGLLNSLSREP
jgi:four helix bundle protein